MAPSPCIRNTDAAATYAERLSVQKIDGLEVVLNQGEKMTDANYAHIVLIVDRSGSMQSIRSDAQGAVNSFIEAQKQVPGKATFTLVEFDTQYDIVQENVDIQDANEYVLYPRGGTALLDAWGNTFNSTGEFLAGLPEDERPGKVVVAIVTDGHENSSREFTYEQIKTMTETQRNDFAWEVIFLAANQDAVAVGGQLGVAAGSALTYAATGAGAQASFASVTNYVTATRSGKKAEFTDEDRKAATK